MPIFHYSARFKGRLIHGVLHAFDSGAAAEQLLDQEMEPITIDLGPSTNPWQDWWNRVSLSGWPSVDDVTLFARQMYTLTHSGVPLVRAFQGLQENAINRRMREALGSILSDLQSGKELSSALAEHPNIFGRLFVRLVRVGEQTGHLDESFKQLFEYLEVDKEARRRVKSALRYPMFVMISVVIALFVVNLFVIPAFAGLFSKFGAELPLATRILLVTSSFTKKYWFLIVLGSMVSSYLFVLFLKSKKGRYYWDKKIFTLPIVGSLIHRAVLARLTRTFSLCSRSGLSAVHTLHTVADALDNVYMQEKLLEMCQGVERGESLTQSAYQSGLFTSLILQMMAVGDETGRMDQMMLDMADFYDREVTYEVKAMSAAIEPILTFIVAVLVLILALGIFLPMWDLGSVALRKR